MLVNFRSYLSRMANDSITNDEKKAIAEFCLLIFLVSLVFIGWIAIGITLMVTGGSRLYR